MIFITEEDVLGAGLPLYHIDRIVKETGRNFGDGSHIIYANACYKNDDDPVGRLMHDFRCTSSIDMFYPVLASQVKYFKETEGGQEIMSKAFEDLAKKWAAERAEETRIETLLDAVKNLMSSMKLTAEQAMAALNVSENDQAVLKAKF